MAGENKKVKRYRKKVVDLNKKIDFMTEMIMNKDNQIEQLEKSVKILSEPDEEEIDAKQDREGDREGSEIRTDLEASEGDS